jgi:hypothetical protein
MSDRVESIFAGTAGLALAAFVALYLALARGPASSEPEAHDRLIRLIAIAIAAQGLHFVEELATGFHRRFPEFLSFEPWPAQFFVAFNVLWIVLWIVSVFGVRENVAAAYFPIWFLAIGMSLNGLVHPLLALASGGYFPGLISSPVVGALGVVLCRRLWELTSARF